MSGGRFGDVREFPELDSTNRYLLDEARRGAPEGVVAVTDHQSAGRGRLGRRWEAPPGSSLLVSVLLRPPLEAGQFYLATAALALAARAACSSSAGVEAGCKWPNDLMVDDRKLAGVLAEVDPGGPGDRAGQGTAVVVGLGLNIAWPGPPGAGGTCLEELTARPVSRAGLLEALLAALEPRRAALEDAIGREELVGELRAHSATLGRRVRVERSGGQVIGRAVALNANGHLIVDDGRNLHDIAAGDVVHLRAAPGEVH